MEKQNGLAHKAVKAMASVARTIARDGIDGRCFVIVHKPKSPKNLAKRLESL
ncbi:MAG: cyclic lactone autoinducer peptide [Defluviitaleaceae bacterium]|nr:cyclic lactone autoinducer peptide [Defluviitaleaceae bacterium]